MNAIAVDQKPVSRTRNGVTVTENFNGDGKKEAIWWINFEALGQHWQLCQYLFTYCLFQVVKEEPIYHSCSCSMKDWRLPPTGAEFSLGFFNRFQDSMSIRGWQIGNNQRFALYMNGKLFVLLAPEDGECERGHSGCPVVYDAPMPLEAVGDDDDDDTCEGSHAPAQDPPPASIPTPLDL